ncbi:MAG TPA: ectonucleotide pyrophosphatase/phosphodiesterase [Rhizomicrobium sp.]
MRLAGLKFYAVVLAFLGLCMAAPAQAAERTVVVVLFDGFSPAMMDAAKTTPNFDIIKRDGAWSRHLVPVFPSLSLANHTSFATGCWPEHHGVMSNTFYDPKMGRFGIRATPQDDDADWHQGCESMWEAAKRQGVSTAVYNWAGRASGKRGILATFANPLVAWGKRPTDQWVVAQAIKMLHDTSPNHPRLIALYMQGPDEFAHYHGVTAPETLAAVRQSDAYVGQLMQAIRTMPASREGTLIIGTDHGMIDVSPMVNMTRLMNMYDIKGKVAADGATAFLYLDKGESADRVANALAPYKYAFDVYRTGHYPSFAHLGTGPRLGDLLVVAHPPYWVVDATVLPQWADWLGVNHIWPPIFTPFTGGLKATHGYDPRIVQMHGIFYAWGSGIAKGKQVDRLDMVDIQPTVMSLLGLQPGRPTDGKIVTSMLAN